MTDIRALRKADDLGDLIAELLAQLKTSATENPTFILTVPSDYTLYRDTIAQVEQAYDSLLDYLRQEPQRFTDDLLRECVVLDDLQYMLNSYYPPAQLDERQEQAFSCADLRLLAKEELERRKTSV